MNRYVNGKVNGYETISVRRNIVGRTNLNSASKVQQFSEALEYFITLVTIQFSGSIFQFVTCYDQRLSINVRVTSWAISVSADWPLPASLDKSRLGNLGCQLLFQPTI